MPVMDFASEPSHAKLARCGSNYSCGLNVVVATTVNDTVHAKVRDPLDRRRCGPSVAAGNRSHLVYLTEGAII